MQGARIAEKRYVRALRIIIKELHAQVMADMSPHLSEVAGARQDAHTSWAKKLATVGKHIEATRKKTEFAFDAMAKIVNDRNQRAAKELIGVTPTTRIAEAIARFRDENIALVEKAGRAYADDVRAVFGDPDNFGRSVDDLRDMLYERGNVSESKAEFIARDQTLKLNGQINMLRQTNAGIEKYTWSTSDDERVRPTHAELDGNEYAWGSPPLIDGEPLEPGEDFQCRCTAIPVTTFDAEDD